MVSKKSRMIPTLALLLGLVVTVYAADTRTKLKPGFNLFSAQQDIEMGRESAKQAERELQVLNDRQSTNYIDSLGKQLAAHAPGNKYPFQFKIVNDTAINAFALPGGFIYVNRGAIDAADTEAQIAGVIAHEIGHVVLRHGTHQVSKAYALQAPFAILGGALGSNSIGSVLTQLGVGFGLNAYFLKNSRDAETQADLMGTQILHDSGYNPRAMVEFFEKIQAESKGRAVEFFSDHPNPENRISNVQHEIEKLGGAPPNPREDNPEFHTVKTTLASMPAPRKGARPGTTTSRPSGNRSSGAPPAPSSRMATYSGDDLQFRSLAYGMMMSTFEADYHGQGSIGLAEGTDQLLSDLQRSNAGMRISRGHESIRVGDRQGYLTQASNQSPAGGRENDWIVTTVAPDGLLYYFVGVAPQNDFSLYSRVFEDVIDSVKFR
jgi:hypothetical protein